MKAPSSRQNGLLLLWRPPQRRWWWPPEPPWTNALLPHGGFFGDDPPVDVRVHDRDLSVVVLLLADRRIYILFYGLCAACVSWWIKSFSNAVQSAPIKVTWMLMRGGWRGKIILFEMDAFDWFIGCGFVRLSWLGVIGNCVCFMKIGMYLMWFRLFIWCCFIKKVYWISIDTYLEKII